MIAFAMKSVTSAKEYLFVNSVGQGCEPHDNGVGAGEEDEIEEDNYNNAGSTLDTNSLKQPVHSANPAIASGNVQRISLHLFPAHPQACDVRNVSRAAG